MIEKVKIIFEDEDILAIDKPSGLVVHTDGRTEEKSLVDWLKENYSKEKYQLEKIGNPHTLDSGRYFARWGIVNRLDRDTSGIILIAKNENSFLYLQKQFQNHTVKKEYIALTWGKIPLALLKEGGSANITEPISRHKKDPRIWVAGTGVGERLTKKATETDVEFISYDENKNQSLLKLFPKTGRTHQLRLHCRFIGHPIVGDVKYGINGITNEHGTGQIKKVLEELDFYNHPQPLLQKEGGSRLMLHAKSLEFIHLVTNQKIKIETELPENFT